MRDVDVEQIEYWAECLTPEQMRKALVELVHLAIEHEELSFGEAAPYWSNTGDSLVDGQDPYPEQDD